VDIDAVVCRRLGCREVRTEGSAYCRDHGAARCPAQGCETLVLRAYYPACANHRERVRTP